MKTIDTAIRAPLYRKNTMLQTVPLSKAKSEIPAFPFEDSPEFLMRFVCYIVLNKCYAVLGPL